MKKHNKIEELLEGLAVEGTESGSGHFTISPDQVWKGLGHAVSDGLNLPRFALRWLISRHPRRVEVRTDGALVSITAPLPYSPEAEQPHFDYSGKDIDLARCLVSAQKMKARDLRLTLQGPDASWLGSFSADSPERWVRGGGRPDSVLRLEFQVPARKVFKGWEDLVRKHFFLAPVSVLWNGVAITKLFEFQPAPLVWRRLVPQTADQPKLNVRVPERAVAEFVCTRRWDNELLMGLSSHQVSRIKLVHNGELFGLQRPGFLPGFDILVNATELATDMQGLTLVENKQLDQLLETLREEAYDMALQLFHAVPPPSRQELTGHLVAMQSVLVYLLNEKRFVEGAALVEWMNRILGSGLPRTEPAENYTYFRTAALHCERAGRHHLFQIFDKRAREIISESGGDFAVEAALVDAHLEAKSRRGEADLLTHHTRSSLHVLGVRCRKQGALEQAFRLHYVLVSSIVFLEQEHLDLWFEVAEMARDLNRLDHLKRLLRLLQRSKKRGTVNLGPAIRARANAFADLVS